MIVVDPRNDRARQLKEAVFTHLPQSWTPPDGVVVVFGGDGFMLRTVDELGFDRRYLGLNAGQLGFLLNDLADPRATAAALAGGHWRAHAFPLIEAELHLTDGSTMTTQAINDIYLERMTGQAARLQLSVSGYVVVERLVADGLIFASALGSTAYSLSAGGQPLHPTLRAMQVTPICPHRPRLNSFVLPPSDRAQVDVQQHTRRPVRAVADGRAIDHVLHMTVGLSETSVSLCYLDGHDFTGQMLRKIIHP